jgi:hypothetical protein
MTGYTVHTGSTEKYAAGWDQIFSGGAKKKKAAKKSVGKKSGTRKAAGKKSLNKKS